MAEDRQEIMRIVAEHTHPWLEQVSGRGSYGKWRTPSYGEVVAAAERVIEALEKHGFEIVRKR